VGISERKRRERVEREQRIIAAARSIAEREGWSAVTIRRLADEIEYSQPVIYSHFENRDAIVEAVAIEGFREITQALQAAARRCNKSADVPRKVAMAYLDFARKNSAVYEAMFVLPTGLRFAEADTRPELKDAFAALAAVVDRSKTDTELVTETLWAALHGLAELERTNRVRYRQRETRVALLVDSLL
jgi:AcrR family transcriptional regulator